MSSLKSSILLGNICTYYFLYNLLHLFIFVPIAYITVYPFSKRNCTNLLHTLYLPALYYYLYPLLRFKRMDIKLYVEKGAKKFIGKEYTIALANHPCELDWIIMTLFLNHHNIYQKTRALIRSSTGKFPIVGTVLDILGNAFIHRSFKDDENILIEKSKSWEEFDRPFLIFLIPEGTRITEEKHAASNKFAAEKGLSQLKHHLLPRVKGFETIFKVVKHKLDAITDFQFAFDGAAPTFQNILEGNLIRVHIFVRRIPTESVTACEEDLPQYFYKLYQEKDEFMESFNKNGNFLDVAGITEDEVITIKAPKYMSTVIFFAVTLQTWGILYCLYALYMYEYYIILFSIFTIFVIGYFIMIKFLDSLTLKTSAAKDE